MILRFHEEETKCDAKKAAEMQRSNQVKEKGNEDDNKDENGSDVEIIYTQNGERN